MTTRRTSSGSRRGRRRSAASCAWASTPTRTRCLTGSRATWPGSKRFALLIIEAAGPYAAAIKPNLAFYEALRVGRAGRPRADPRAASRRTSRSSSMPSAATSGRRRPSQARGAVRRPRRRRRDRQPISGQRGPRAAVRARRSLRLRPVPDLQPRRRPRSRTSLVAADPDGGAPAEPLYPRVARRVVDAGARAARSASWSARPRRPSCARSGPSRPGWPSSFPGSAPRAATSNRSSRDGPATAAPAGGEAGRGLLVNVSRGISPAAVGAGRRRPSGRRR